MIKLDFAPQPMVKVNSSNISNFALHENLLAQQPYVYSFSKVRKSSTRRKNNKHGNKFMYQHLFQQSSCQRRLDINGGKR
jgi:hypothetical protein